MRIFEKFTKLVIMIKNVISDLQEFMIFYFLLLLMFSVILGVLGLGNFEDTQNAELKELMLEAESNDQTMVEYPGIEYRNIKMFFQNIIVILRYSLGDYDFEAVNYLNDYERALFWITWAVIVIMTAVVFLNFIIAEVS